MQRDIGNGHVKPKLPIFPDFPTNTSALESPVLCVAGPTLNQDADRLSERRRHNRSPPPPSPQISDRPSRPQPPQIRHRFHPRLRRILMDRVRRLLSPRHLPLPFSPQRFRNPNWPLLPTSHRSHCFSLLLPRRRRRRRPLEPCSPLRRRDRGCGRGLRVLVLS